MGKSRLLCQIYDRFYQAVIYSLAPDCAEGDLIERFTASFNKLVNRSSVWRLAKIQPTSYSILNRLADGVPARSDGLRCQPVFSGSRQQTDRRGVWSGISETNFTIGHFARSLLEGVVTEFDNFYHQMQKSGLSARPKLVGSGNGIRQNRVLQQAIEGTFLTSVLITVHTEEAAVGTVLSAAVAIGRFETINTAGQHFIRYRATPKNTK